MCRSSFGRFCSRCIVQQNRIHGSCSAPKDVSSPHVHGLKFLHYHKQYCCTECLPINRLTSPTSLTCTSILAHIQPMSWKWLLFLQSRIDLLHIPEICWCLSQDTVDYASPWVADSSNGISWWPVGSENEQTRLLADRAGATMKFLDLHTDSTDTLRLATFLPLNVPSKASYVKLGRCVCLALPQLLHLVTFEHFAVAKRDRITLVFTENLPALPLET